MADQSGLSDAIVIAVGGNALLPEASTAGGMPSRIASAAAAIAELRQGRPTVVTHGNGPHIGLLAQREAWAPAAERLSLDVLGAQTAGHLGYLLAQELGRFVGHDHVAVVLTRVAVRRDDPAFARPTKPVGPAGGDRRLVASPDPVQVVDRDAVHALLCAGLVVVCLGGGGIPVVRDGETSQGVEAVIDKDLASALLAQDLGAHGLIILTDVDGVYADFGLPSARRIQSGGVAHMRRLTLPAGSMGPKVEALCRFVEGGGQFAACGALDQPGDILRGAGGTRVLPDPAPLVLLGQGSPYDMTAFA